MFRNRLVRSALGFVSVLLLPLEVLAFTLFLIVAIVLLSSR